MSTTDGDLVLLADQDRARWHHAQIAEGAALVEQALARRRIGPYQLEAAIAAVHATSPSAEATDWTEITALYGVLARIAPSPVVSLNRAAAVAMADGAGAGLALLDDLDRDGELSGSYLLHSARADLLRRLGRCRGGPRRLRAGAGAGRHRSRGAVPAPPPGRGGRGRLIRRALQAAARCRC